MLDHAGDVPLVQRPVGLVDHLDERLDLIRDDCRPEEAFDEDVAVVDEHLPEPDGDVVGGADMPLPTAEGEGPRRFGSAVLRRFGVEVAVHQPTRAAGKIILNGCAPAGFSKPNVQVNSALLLPFCRTRLIVPVWKH